MGVSEERVHICDQSTGPNSILDTTFSPQVFYEVSMSPRTRGGGKNMATSSTARAQELRGSQKLLERLAKNGDVPSLDEIKKALKIKSALSEMLDQLQ